MYGYEYSNQISHSINGILIWTIISVVVAIAGGIAIYFAFLKNNNKLNGFLGKLRDFLNFKTLLIEEILKISYLVLAIFITLYSFGFIGTNVGLFLWLLIGGNIILRISYELSILIIKICKNTTEINNKLKK